MVKAHLHRSVRDSHNNHKEVSDGDNNHNNAPVDIGEAALEGVRGGLVPGAPQAGVVAEPLPRKLPRTICLRSRPINPNVVCLLVHLLVQ